jgi:hypothetical protein
MRGEFEGSPLNVLSLNLSGADRRNAKRRAMVKTPLGVAGAQPLPDAPVVDQTQRLAQWQAGLVGAQPMRGEFKGRPLNIFPLNLSGADRRDAKRLIK